ncbi:hypothetical protein PUW24_15055 [Paenibacillus urinalis]|uniref:Uncharacterized protein n=1 Tax=Paenibacillus urinalis TaxID=521520 RepID=A0AAX3N355_9BACL|nr:MULTISPECIES: hypothetical protein [Paenibacillus]WDH84088.1 hypothetical protein PUW23_07700 [Paenibacillus urinalis]WDH95531.1 hypothetical protein PUW24_15055 [Paenibacillus urinalis]WDI03728.1 hypothetical protein PUW25_07175 [Paenibacillus urinalis]GAK38937.1 hypothetical protein TCA2_0663 [Paenibacillus sp. TCA20]
MTVLLSLSFYLIPVLGIFFVITLLEAIKKIVITSPTNGKEFAARYVLD